MLSSGTVAQLAQRAEQLYNERARMQPARKINPSKYIHGSLACALQLLSEMMKNFSFLDAYLSFSLSRSGR